MTLSITSKHLFQGSILSLVINTCNVICIIQCCALVLDRSTFDAGSLTSQACLKPLLKQVINDILDPSKTDLADIENRSSGFKDLLKSGFGLVYMYFLIV